MSTTQAVPPPATPWRTSAFDWAAVTLSGAALLVVFWPGLRFMVANWTIVEEYSYGWFIPPVVAFLIWQRSDHLREADCRGTWWGLLPIALALVMAIVANLGAIRLLGQYGFIVALFGGSLCLVGWRGTRIVGVPLATLLFMIPLPPFFLRELSAQLQLWSSELGVALMRAMDISVFLEGNVIDLGKFKLQVVEACSGLRYLFPLLVLGFLVAYFFRAPFWKRATLVLSTIPMTIVINSLRIAVIGYTVEHWGIAMAEGLLHDFEGLFMFMLCIVLLLLEMALLARLGGSPLPFREAFGMELPAPAQNRPASRPLPPPALGGTLTLMLAAALFTLVPARQPLHPDRPGFNSFPMQLDGGWRGRSLALEPDVVAILALDDYLVADYLRPGQPPVNFYSAYYASQSGGESTHSPRTCIPGGGWKISSMADAEVPLPDRRLRVNRALIEKAEQRQLVYYWFHERGDTMTSEYAVKWSILRDALVRGRTDGALLRLVTPVLPSETEAQADARLAAFLSVLQPRLAGYLPD